MYLKTKGLVLRETRIREADKLLTLLVPGRGRITVKARGVLKEKSRSAAACQLFCWSSFELYENRGLMTVTEAVPEERFEGLQNDAVKLSLAAYIAEICELLSETDSVSDDLLRLALNMLYALSARSDPPELVRAAFEARALVCAGYSPQIGVCAVCGGAPEAPVVSLTELTVRCARCGAPAPGERPLSNEAFAALSHFVSAPLKRLLPPPAVPEPLAELTGVTESWADSRIGGRGSRNYYKGMLNYG